MDKDIEYQIYIGCKDGQTKLEEVNIKQLSSLISEYFSKYNIDFSMFPCKGGYLGEDNEYVLETTLCIDLIGDQNLDVRKFASGLSMYMNQECILISKEPLEREYY